MYVGGPFEICSNIHQHSMRKHHGNNGKNMEFPSLMFATLFFYTTKIKYNEDVCLEIQYEFIRNIHTRKFHESENSDSNETWHKYRLAK